MSEHPDHRLFTRGQDGVTLLGRSGLHVLDRRTLTPLRNGLGVDAQFTAQLGGRSPRSLYCGSDSVRGRGASMTNVSCKASFHNKGRIAPSNREIKHLHDASRLSFEVIYGRGGHEPHSQIPAGANEKGRSRLARRRLIE